MIPVGVCYAVSTDIGDTDSVSYEYQCVNHKIYYNTYRSLNCNNDDLVSSQKISNIYGAYQYKEYCNLGGCEYLKSRTYSQVFNKDTECDTFQDNDLSAFVETVYISNYCNSVIGTSYKLICDDTSATKQYYSNQDCSGDPYYIDLYSYNIDCITSDTTSVTTAIEVECGMTSDTLDKASTVSPTLFNTVTNPNHGHILHTFCICFFCFVCGILFCF